MPKGLPKEWMNIPAGGRLTEQGLCTRFSEHTYFELERIAAYHDCSMATIVRILVNRGLAEALTRAA